MKEPDLVWMMFENEPIETFEKLLNEDSAEFEWGYLLHMCYCEESYESVGGDDGYMKNPPINYERLAYLEKLINFLESKGIVEETK
ncbi:MAG: hypothetical protein IJC74_05430 [Clostridia bacterium]|nr:hypothetical protein [Clostridia bacterium]